MPFRTLFCVCFGFLVIGVLGCDAPHKKVVNNSALNKTANVESSDTMDNVVENIDTTINIKIDGRNYLLKTDKYNLPELIKIEKIAKTFQNKKLDSSKVEYSDVTGDGIPEKIVMKTSLIKNSIVTLRAIYQNGKAIYKDTLHADGPTFIDNKRYHFLKKYGYFYEDIASREILEDSNVNYKDEIENESEGFDWVGARRSELERKNLSKSEIEHQLELFKVYVFHFKGRFIKVFDGPDEWDEIWYEPEKKFIK